MSTITKQIAAVEFQANAKQANTALQSIQNDAVKAREKVEDLQRQLKQAEVKNLGAEAVEELRINLREATKDMRTFETAQQSLMKGVKAFDELWKHAKAGTIERLTGQQIQAGINAAKVQLGRLKADIPEDQAKRSAIFSMTDEARKVLSRMKLDTDNIIQVLERGGSVANDVLERELALKTIWIDDNYFNARSMDVYITKLRKHLKDDPSIEINNVHGKGYRLIVPNLMME